MAKGKLATRKKRSRQTRRRTKETRRQRGGTTDAQIKELLTRYFPTFHRYVQERKVYLFCNPSEHGGMDLNTNPAHEFEEPPIQFEIIPSKRSLMLYSLRQCPGHSGISILQRIIMIGQELSLHSIELEDLSMVGCDYPLYTLSILRHGESWYHRMGFRSEDVNEDARHKRIYDTIRTLPFEKFVPIMFHAYGKDTSTTFTKSERDAYLTQWYKAFPETRGFTVAQVAQMEEWRTISCDDPRSTLLRDFLLMAKSALPYDSYLYLNLRHPHKQDA